MQKSEYIALMGRQKLGFPEQAEPQELVRWAAETFADKVTMASSLGLEDQILTHLIAQYARSIRIFTLDMGRLFQETYDLIERTEHLYGLTIHILFPEASEVEHMVNTHGPNLFRQSVDQRKQCCSIRKVAPLKRELARCDAWICGLRREQSVTREDLSPIQWDEANHLVKISPLASWSEKQVWDYVHENCIPYNPLHDAGFASIGCACCTRAIREGEDARAGRWWWENPEHKECGLHLAPGVPRRKKEKP